MLRGSLLTPLGVSGLLGFPVGLEQRDTTSALEGRVNGKTVPARPQSVQLPIAPGQLAEALINRSRSWRERVPRGSLRSCSTKPSGKARSSEICQRSGTLTEQEQAHSERHRLPISLRESLTVGGERVFGEEEPSRSLKNRDQL